MSEGLSDLSRVSDEGDPGPLGPKFGRGGHEGKLPENQVRKAQSVSPIHIQPIQ